MPQGRRRAIVGFEDRLVAEVVGERDLDGAIVVGSAEPEPVIASPSSKPAQVKKTIEWLYSSSRLACMAP